MHILNKKIQVAKDIVLRAINIYNPQILLVGFSGGTDSTLLFELMKELDFKFTPFFCDTGIKIPETLQFIQRRCDESGLKLVVEKPSYKSYEEMVLQFGFPSAPQHIQMYSNLKEKSIRKICKKWTGRKLIITGVRATESARRTRNAVKEIDKRGHQIWVNPILDFDDDDKAEYFETRKIEISPVSLNLGMSGDCLCGAYAKKGELERIQTHYPIIATEIKALQDKAFNKGFTWGWDDDKPKEKFLYMMRI